jgi:hypothetical protein
MTWEQVGIGLLLVATAGCLAAAEPTEDFPYDRSKQVFASLDFEFLVALPFGVDSDEVFARVLIQLTDEALRERIRLTEFDFHAWVDGNADGLHQSGERETSEGGKSDGTESFDSDPVVLPYEVGMPIGYELIVVTTRSRTTVRGHVDPW